MAEQIQTPVSPEKPLNFSGDPLGLFDKSPEQSTPIPGGIRHTIPGLQSYNQAEAFKSTLANAPAYATDKFQYGKTYAYGADYTDQAFERYYSHAKFNKLGFKNSLSFSTCSSTSVNKYKFPNIDLADL